MSKDIEKKWKLSGSAKRLPKAQRHKLPAEAFEEKATKIRITAYIDMDVLNHFKARAAADGVPYQTQINKELRAIMESEKNNVDPGVQLRQAKGLIDAALRKIG